MNKTINRLKYNISISLIITAITVHEAKINYRHECPKDTVRYPGMAPASGWAESEHENE